MSSQRGSMIGFMLANECIGHASVARCPPGVDAQRLRAV